MTSTEVRHTAETGGQKGRKPEQMSSAAPAGLRALARVYGHGAEKYEAHNYRRGYPISWSLDALWRHVVAFMDGETTDPESGEPHLAHAAWHCLTMIQTLQDHPQFDDRYPYEIERALERMFDE